jgi:dTDP-4-amino-4,6-dideoxygalactose transaminase
VVPAINGKMSEYHAAVGLAELDGWEQKHFQLSRVAELYRLALGSLGLGVSLHTAPDISSCYILFRAADRGASLKLETTLTADNIGFRHWYASGLHTQHRYRSCAQENCPNSELLATTLIGLPMALDLTDLEINRVADSIYRGLNSQKISAPRHERVSIY